MPQPVGSTIRSTVDTLEESAMGGHVTVDGGALPRGRGDLDLTAGQGHGPLAIPPARSPLTAGSKEEQQQSLVNRLA